MTGRHNGHGVARDNVPHYATYLRDEDTTVAEILRAAGYRCGGVGKWSLGDAHTVGRATNQGFDMWLGYLNQDHAHYYYPEYLDDSEGREGRMNLPDNSRTRAAYSDDLLIERALRFIEDAKDGPFFLYGAFTVPHFASEEEDPDGLAVPSVSPYEGRPWSPGARKYAAMVTRFDRNVGRIVDLLDRLGLTANTLIIVTSDNGPLGGPVGDVFRSQGGLRGVKRDLHEGGIRVPFIARWPGAVPPGAVSDELIAFWDMLPTLAELAGARVPAGLDGTSIMGALCGGQVSRPHEYLYWDYGHGRTDYRQAVRAGDWKGLRGAGRPFELYDLSKDPGEQHNVAAAHPDMVGRLAGFMAAAFTADPRYEIGRIYEGAAIWRRSDHW
jgi:arylsulfatase A-like enzyme